MHNFLDTPNDIRDCTHNSETTQHYLLHCINYIDQRRNLFHTLNPLFEANNFHYPALAVINSGRIFFDILSSDLNIFLAETSVIDQEDTFLYVVRFERRY